MNSNIVKAGALATGTIAAGSVLTYATLKTTGKIAGKPIGVAGSTAHVLTNDKLDKAEYQKELAKTQAKDLGKALGLAGIAAGVAAGVSKLSQVSEPFAKGLSSAKENIANFAKNHLPNPREFAQKTITDLRTSGSELSAKLNSLPKPAKAAILAGAAVLAAAVPVLVHKSNMDSAYIEAKNETK